MSLTETKTLRNDMRSAFVDVGLNSVDDDILSKCMALAIGSSLTPSQLSTTWEAFSINKNTTELTDHTFPAFRSAVLKDHDSAVMTNKRPYQGHPMVTPDAKRMQVDGPLSSTSAVDAVRGVTSRRISMSPNKQGRAEKRDSVTLTLPKYEERTGVGKVIVSYAPKFNPSIHTMVKHHPATSKPRCIVSTTKFDTNITKPYRHMFTTLEEKAQILDAQLLTVGEHIVDNLVEHETASLEAVGVPRQEKVTCIGRICNEAHEGRINQTSVLLEGSRHFSNGTRVSVDLSQINQDAVPYSFFPGQIVAVEGMNVSGRKVVPSRIFTNATPAPVRTKASDLLRLHHDLQDGMPLKLMTACGPYTSTHNLEYAPLMDLFEIVRSQRPDIVILAGPFVPISNSETTLELEDGSKMQVTYEVFFANKVASLLEELFDNEQDLQTQFVLVPSLEDAVAEWVYPQPPLADRLPSHGKMLNLPGAEGVEVGNLGLHHVETVGRANKGPQRIHCVSNPCTLQVNEVVIGITSNDIIFQISADETNANLPPGSRLPRIAEHLLQQGNYHPLFPPAVGTNLDLRQIDKCRLPCQPDILLVPSKLTCFAKVICNSTLVVNPGHLTKGTTGGTYAVMDIQPTQRDVLENAGGEDVELLHAIQDRVAIEIKRI